eukprot:Rhum_TRINITY_DN13430_c0_g1::Rhum_TRINITY_DN13430_c0_g1_i1::g.60227::m.60227
MPASAAASTSRPPSARAPAPPPRPTACAARAAPTGLSAAAAAASPPAPSTSASSAPPTASAATQRRCVAWVRRRCPTRSRVASRRRTPPQAPPGPPTSSPPPPGQPCRWTSGRVPSARVARAATPWRGPAPGRREEATSAGRRRVRRRRAETGLQRGAAARPATRATPAAEAAAGVATRPWADDPSARGSWRPSGCGRRPGWRRRRRGPYSSCASAQRRRSRRWRRRSPCGSWATWRRGRRCGCEASFWRLCRRPSFALLFAGKERRGGGGVGESVRGWVRRYGLSPGAARALKSTGGALTSISMKYRYCSFY